MPLALDAKVVFASETGEMYLDNGLVVVEKQGKRRVIGRWDPPLVDTSKN